MKLTDFRRGVLVVDAEFISRPGERPDPVCICWREVLGGSEGTLWLYGQRPSGPPFPTGAGTLLVAYSARAELSVFSVLGWPMPANVLDLHVEHLRLTNGARTETCRLLSLRRQLGLPAPAVEEKEEMIALVLRGGPYSKAEQKAILEYCLADARMLERPLLLLASKPELSGSQLRAAIELRGEFMKSATWMEFYGLPIDTELYGYLRDGGGGLWSKFVSELDTLRLYADGHFRHERLEAWVKNSRADWPRTRCGRLATDEDTWSAMIANHPCLQPYGELDSIAGWMRQGLDLLVGTDGRSRPVTIPFEQKAGRTSGRKSFLFGLPKWLRGLLKPSPGESVFVADYSQQEPALAGALSRDPGLRRCYHTDAGSYYVHAMREIGIVPPGATRATHPEAHKVGKVCMLAVQYGAGAGLVARQLKIGTVEAGHLLRRLKDQFATFFAWQADCVLWARARGYVAIQDGWRLRVDESTPAGTLLNWPMQACGSLVTRLATINATRAGLRVLATVHDSLVCAADAEDQGARARLDQAMDEAAEWLAPGYGIRHDVACVEAPGRYIPEEKSARDFYRRIVTELAALVGRDPAPWL
jgi:DNA polymerase family A